MARWLTSLGLTLVFVTTGWAQVPHSGDMNANGTINITDLQCGILVRLWEDDSSTNAYPGCAAFPEDMGSSTDRTGADIHDLDCDAGGGTDEDDHAFTTLDVDLLTALALSLSVLNEDPNHTPPRPFLHLNCRVFGCPYATGAYGAAAGSNNSMCALTDSGSAWCWGNNEKGNFGNYTASGTAHPTPVLHAREAVYEKIVGAPQGNAAHTCAIRSDGGRNPELQGTLWCWGNNNRGQLGQGDNVDRSSPALVGTVLDTWVDVAAGGEHTCAIRQEGEGNALYCWGYNANRQLALPSSVTETNEIGDPIDPIGDDPWRAVVAGRIHSCAIVDNEDSDAYCWGSNSDGRLGIAEVDSDPPSPGAGSYDSPQLVTGDLEWKQLAAYGGSMCGIATVERADRLYCWGLNGNGQLGLGDTTSRFWPHAVDATRVYLSVTVGLLFACGLATEPSRLRCWGNNFRGQLGYSTAPDANSLVPQDVDSQAEWQWVEAGGTHACAGFDESPDGELYCWGANSWGQLGLGFTSTQASTPQLVEPFLYGCCGDGECVSPEGESTCPEDCP